MRRTDCSSCRGAQRKKKLQHRDSLPCLLSPDNNANLKWEDSVNIALENICDVLHLQAANNVLSWLILLNLTSSPDTIAPDIILHHLKHLVSLTGTVLVWLITLSNLTIRV